MGLPNWEGGECYRAGQGAPSKPHSDSVTFSSTSDKHRRGKAGLPSADGKGPGQPLLLTSPRSPQCITFFHPILSSCHPEIFLQMGGLAISFPSLWSQISHPEDMLRLSGLCSALQCPASQSAQCPLVSDLNETSVFLDTFLKGQIDFY